MTIAPESLLSAVQSGDAATLNAMLAANRELARCSTAQGLSLILWALYHGRREAALILASARESLDIFEAAALGQLPALMACLCTDPDAAQGLSVDGFPPLGLALFFGQLRCAAALLASGADVNRAAQNPNRVAPIHAACAQADEDLACRSVHLLLAFGVDLDARQQGGWTALMAAAHRDQARLIRLLRLAGADPLLRNDAGASAADLARNEGREAALLALT